MKFYLTILIVFILSVQAFSQTQSSINQSAAKQSAAADKALNQVYQKLLDEYKKDAVFVKALRTSQRVWIQFRDAELSMMYPARTAGYYGSAMPACKAEYLASLTLERTAKLQQWLDGQEEGDSCGSSVRTKR